MQHLLQQKKKQAEKKNGHKCRLIFPIDGQLFRLAVVNVHSLVKKEAKWAHGSSIISMYWNYRMLLSHFNLITFSISSHQLFMKELNLIWKFYRNFLTRTCMRLAGRHIPHLMHIIIDIKWSTPTHVFLLFFLSHSRLCWLWTFVYYQPKSIDNDWRRFREMWNETVFIRWNHIHTWLNGQLLFRKTNKKIPSKPHFTNKPIFGHGLVCTWNIWMGS